MLHKLRDITQRVAADAGIWAAIVQAAGKHFSVGMDVAVIGEMVAMQAETFAEAMRDAQDCLDQFDALEKPTIAKIQGYCLGGGLLLALCCDFRIASMEAVFGFPEVKRSFAVILGTQRVTRVAGLAATKEMILLADDFDARRALSYGLLTRTVPPEELDAAVGELAVRLRALPPRAAALATD